MLQNEDVGVKKEKNVTDGSTNDYIFQKGVSLLNFLVVTMFTWTDRNEKVKNVLLNV